MIVVICCWTTLVCDITNKTIRRRRSTANLVHAFHSASAQYFMDFHFIMGHFPIFFFFLSNRLRGHVIRRYSFCFIYLRMQNSIIHVYTYTRVHNSSLLFDIKCTLKRGAFVRGGKKGRIIISRQKSTRLEGEWLDLYII